VRRETAILQQLYPVEEDMHRISTSEQGRQGLRSSTDCAETSYERPSPSTRTCSHALSRGRARSRTRARIYSWSCAGCQAAPEIPKACCCYVCR
jgi:hypothetical protein